MLLLPECHLGALGMRCLIPCLSSPERPALLFILIGMFLSSCAETTLIVEVLVPSDYPCLRLAVLAACVLFRRLLCPLAALPLSRPVKVAPVVLSLIIRFIIRRVQVQRRPFPLDDRRLFQLWNPSLPRFWHARWRVVTVMAALGCWIVIGIVSKWQVPVVIEGWWVVQEGGWRAAIVINVFHHHIIHIWNYYALH